MTRIILIACVLFIGCDRADELLAAAVLEAIADRPVAHSDHAVDCAKGLDRYIAPGVQATIDCRPLDAGRRTR
jgi:hypothetical protein